MATQNTHDYADHFPKRANQSVRNMVFAADVDKNGYVRMELGKPPALDADGIFAALSIATALTKNTTGLLSHRANMGRYGRNVTIVLSGAGAPTVTVYGLDYLGQPMAEQFTGNGTTPVVGKKAFKEVTSISSTLVAATTMNVGYGDILGLPYATTKLETELMDTVAATAGTFVTALQTAQTATSNDPRGTYLPNSAPNGSRDYVLVGIALEGDLHGLAHYAG